MMKISFDFDGTLNDQFGGGDNPHKDDVRNFAAKLVATGQYEVYIITRRYGPLHPSGYAESFPVYEVASQLKLPALNIFYTNREMKFSTINKLAIDIHLDDDDRDLELIAAHTDCVGVNVETGNWQKQVQVLLDIVS